MKYRSTEQTRLFEGGGWLWVILKFTATNIDSPGVRRELCRGNPR